MDIEELRSYKIFGMAIFDWVISIIFILILHRYLFKEKIELHKLIIFIIPLSIFVHKITNTKTKLTEYFDEYLLIKLLAAISLFYMFV